MYGYIRVRGVIVFVLWFKLALCCGIVSLVSSLHYGEPND